MAAPTQFGPEFGIVLDALKKRREAEAQLPEVGQVETRPNIVPPGAIRTAIDAQDLARQEAAPERPDQVPPVGQQAKTKEKLGIESKPGDVARGLAALFSRMG